MECHLQQMPPWGRGNPEEGTLITTGAGTLPPMVSDSDTLAGKYSFAIVK